MSAKKALRFGRALRDRKKFYCYKNALRLQYMQQHIHVLAHIFVKREFLVVFFIFCLDNLFHKKRLLRLEKPLYGVAFPVTRKRSTSCCSSGLCYGKFGCSFLFDGANISSNYYSKQVLVKIFFSFSKSRFTICLESPVIIRLYRPNRVFAMCYFTLSKVATGRNNPRRSRFFN